MLRPQQRFESLVKTYSGDIFRYAYWLCRNRALAEDLVQETFLRAWRSFDDLRDDGKAKGWLMTTVRREYARQFEGYQPEFIDPKFIDMEPVGSDGYGDSLSINHEVRELRRAIARLPERYREPLALQVIGGYSGEEIADLLGLTRDGVMTRLFRARQKLRKIMQSGTDSNVSRLYAL